MNVSEAMAMIFLCNIRLKQPKVTNEAQLVSADRKGAIFKLLRAKGGGPSL